MKTVAFFNNKGGAGKTTLVYHIASMIAEHGQTVLAVDLDPQAILTSMFLTEEQLELLWPNGEHPHTIYGALRPIIRGLGDVQTPHVERVSSRLGLVVGDLALSTFEDKLSDAWLRCHNRDPSAFRTMTAFYRGVKRAAISGNASWVLIDVGPNLGAINRAALLASEYVVVPLGPDFLSLQGLRNLGPSLQSWRDGWTDLRDKNPDPDLDIPSRLIEPLGYVVMQHGMQENRPPKASQRWIERFPGAYRQYVLGKPDASPPQASEDPYCLAMLKHYRSLMHRSTLLIVGKESPQPSDGR